MLAPCVVGRRGTERNREVQNEARKLAGAGMEEWISEKHIAYVISRLGVCWHLEVYDMLNVFSHSNILEKDKSFANTPWDKLTEVQKLQN